MDLVLSGSLKLDRNLDSAFRAVFTKKSEALLYDRRRARAISSWVASGRSVLCCVAGKIGWIFQLFNTHYSAKHVGKHSETGLKNITTHTQWTLSCCFVRGEKTKGNDGLSGRNLISFSSGQTTNK